MALKPFITEPGVYPDVTTAQYLADPVVGGSLSSSGARELIKRGGPARYRYKQDHPGQDSTAALDFGIVTHSIVLGADGDRIEVIGAADWKLKATQQAGALARLDGKTPVLRKDFEKAQQMAEAIDAHPTAAGLLRSAGGRPEQTLVWRDEPSGVMCRCRIDWFRGTYDEDRGQTLIVPDLKTARSAEEVDFGKAAAEHGYHQQADFYERGPRALLGDAVFLFVVIEKDPPYLVNVIQLDHDSMVLGRNMNQGALNIYAQASRTGYWPGYGDDVNTARLPGYYLQQYGEAR